MRSRIFPSICSAAVVVLAGLAVPVPASASTDLEPSGSYADPRYFSSTTVEVQGTVTAAEVENLGRHASGSTAYAVTTDDGSVVPIAVTKDLAANAEFSGELVVRGELATALDEEGLLPEPGGTIDADSAAAETAVATAIDQGTPLPVAEATVVEPGETSATVTPSAHRAYVVKMTDQGSVDGTNAEIGARVDAMLAYWTAESDGAISSFNRVGDILDYDQATDVGTADGCGLKSPFTIWNEADDLFPGVSFSGSTGNHLIVLVGEECGTTGPVGVATVGSSLASGGPSILTFNQQTFASTGVHELGHNFGLQHANLDTCPSPAICEYFDLYSPMALSIGSPPVWTPPALGTLYRNELGLTTTSEVTTVASPNSALTQTFELAPRGSASGLRGLLVTDPSSGTVYSVDYRNRTGRDSNPFYGNPQGYVFGSPVPVYPTGVVFERQSGSDATYLMTRTADDRQTGSYAQGTTFSPSPRLSVTVNGTGAAASVTVSIAAPAPPPDLASSTPTISGNATVGETVTAAEGSWTSGASFVYDWKLDGASTGVTTQTYAVPAAAAGKALTVTVTGSKAGFTSVSRTSAAATVAKGALVSAVPTIEGPVTVGETVSATEGPWSAATTFSYLWKVDGASTGVTTQTYAVPASAAGKALTVEVTGSKTGYDSTTRSSGATTVAKAILATSAPTISGAATVGKTVTAQAGTWTDDTEFAYDWKVDGASTGVTTQMYTVPGAAAGKQLTVEVTGTRTGYTAATRASVASTVAKGTLVGAVPRISGTAKVGKTLTIVFGTWTPGKKLTQQWYANGSKISGATRTTFKLTKAQKGKTITVTVTGTKTGYNSLRKTSVKTKKVAK